MESPLPNARIRPLAAQDLENPVQYLDAQSATAGDAFLDDFFEASNLLAEMPRLGSIRRTRGKLKGLRSWPFGYLIFNFPHSNGIEVVRVFHGAMNIDRELRKST